MRKEDIEKAATQYAQTFIEGSITAYNSFKVGADWRINSVWHDTNEKPENERAYLAEYMDGAFIVFYSNIEFDVMAKAYKIRRWTYIDDLLPKRKEDAE